MAVLLNGVVGPMMGESFLGACVKMEPETNWGVPSVGAWRSGFCGDVYSEGDSGCDLAIILEDSGEA